MAKVRAATHQVVDELGDGWEFAEVRPELGVLTPAALALLGPEWAPAPVPGTVASARRARGEFDLDHAQDFDECDFWYRIRFARPPLASGQTEELRLGGLATLAEVWLNGERVLESNNMFVEHALDVTAQAREENELLIRFASLALALAKRRPRPRWRTRLVERQQLRWFRTTLLGRIPPWSPPVAAVGPWRSVSFARRSGPWFPSVNLRTRIAAGRCIVTARLEGTVTSAIEHAVLRVGDTQSALHVSASERTVLEGELSVPNAELWWPHTHGAQPCYPAEVQCTTRDGEFRFDLGEVAFRNIEVATDDGAFTLSVNGREIFCRGACWTTDDIVTLGGEAAPTRTLAQVRAAGMNLLRVGGTMIYENDAFYAACDRAGILLWQDFMFANLDYPGEDADFAANVRREAEQFLSRTQTSPSLAVLCGNSEVEQQVAMLGLPRESWKQPLFEELLRNCAAVARPDVAYVPSTPTGGELPFQVDQGPSHYYGVGAYLRPLEDARQAGVRFTSEALGFANIPEPATLELLLGDGQSPFHHPRWKARVPRDAGPGWDFDDVRDHYTRLLFGVEPTTLRYTDAERALAFGRVTSGEVIMRTLAEFRRARSSCKGALVWFLKDLWPGAGWGLIDARGLPKAAYYYARRALQPLAVFLTDEGLNGFALHAVNDTPVALEVTLRLVLLRTPATIVADTSRSGVVLPAHSALELSTASLLDRFFDTTHAYRFGPPSHDVVLVEMRAAETGEKLAEWAAYPLGLAPFVHQAVLLEASVEVRESGATLTVRSDHFAFAVAIDVRDFVPADAYFHLLPGETRQVELTSTKPGAQPKGFVQALNGRSAVRVVQQAKS